MFSLEPELRELGADGPVIDALIARERHEIVSVFAELRFLTWAGVMLIVTGVGVLVKNHLDQIGPLAIAVGIGAGAAGFTVTPSPSSVSVTQGSTATSTITVASQNGFNSATTLSVSGLPTGVTAAFSPNPITPPANGSATSTLTFTASSTCARGRGIADRTQRRGGYRA